MAESPEHQFIGAAFLQVLSDFSSLELYGYREADRKRFDFAANLTQDWSRPLAGQTLWGHARGMDKDLRMLVTDPESDIKAYVMRDTAPHLAAFSDARRALEQTAARDTLYKLKPIWVPAGFDADDEHQRATMRDILQAAIVEDILFNVVFGRLTSREINMFLSERRLVGLVLALLVFIAEHGVVGNLAFPSAHLGVSAAPVRERLILLEGVGFIANSRGSKGFSFFDVLSPRGRVFIDLLRRIEREASLPPFTTEMTFVLDKLGFATRPLQADPMMNGLLRMIRSARERWGVELDAISYHRE